MLVTVVDNGTGLRADLNAALEDDGLGEHLRPGIRDGSYAASEAEAAEVLRLGRLERWQAVPHLLRTDDARGSERLDVPEARRAD